MLSQIRELLINMVELPFQAAFPGIACVFDNQAFNWNDPPDRFVQFEIQFMDGDQIGASSSPRTRFKGFVYVTANARLGLGSKVTLQELEWFADALKYQSPGPVRLQAPRPTGSAEVKGWYSESLKVDFYADES